MPAASAGVFDGNRRVMDKRYIFIVNPASGAGKGALIAGLLEKLLPAHPQLGGGLVTPVCSLALIAASDGHNQPRTQNGDPHH